MNPNITTICRLLEQDALRNLVTLKMLNRFPNSISFELNEGTDGWALLSLLDAQAFEWDRKTYPACKYVVFINGISATSKLQLLASLPKENLVLKIGDEIVQQAIAQTGKATKVRTFHSFSTGKQSSPGAKLEFPNRGIESPIIELSKSAIQEPPLPKGEGWGEGEARPTSQRQNIFVETPTQSSQHDERAWAMFRANGYEDDELAQYFQNGAQWFGIESEGQLASACFVFQNYKQIWEIGGVFTQPEFRRRGLAQIIVRAALDFVAVSDLVPRYQTTTDNHASLRLARSCGLTEFLQMTHYLLDARHPI